MAALTVTPITQAGVDQTASLVAADAAGDTVVSSSGIHVRVDNGDASPHTVTVTKPSASVICQPYGTVQLDDIVITVAATGTESFTIPLGYAGTDGNFSWTYDDVTSVTVGVFSIA
jgi:hypothetical protein